jgi:hypothetical protein
MKPNALPWMFFGLILAASPGQGAEQPPAGLEEKGEAGQKAKLAAVDGKRVVLDGLVHYKENVCHVTLPSGLRVHVPVAFILGPMGESITMFPEGKLIRLVGTFQIHRMPGAPDRYTIGNLQRFDPIQKTERALPELPLPDPPPVRPVVPPPPP